MNTRDYDYIENRLYDAGSATEAAGRLRQVGRPDLAERVMEAAKIYMDELRLIRQEIQGQRGNRH